MLQPMFFETTRAVGRDLCCRVVPGVPETLSETTCSTSHEFMFRAGPVSVGRFVIEFACFV